MKSNRILAIVGLVATFAVTFAIGMLLPVNEWFGIKGRAEKKAEAEAEAIAKAKSDSIAFAQAEQARAAAAASVDKTNNTPVIEPCQAVGIKNRFGFQLSAKATVPSGAPLVYELCEVGTTAPKYKSETGHFGSRNHPVVPSESGSYDLIVTNAQTGDFAVLTVAGFDKFDKLSAAQLQAQLNADNYTDDFYKYLVEAKNQKIEYENLPEGTGDMSNVDVLGPQRNAFGWKLEVVPGSIRYDRYNRVQGFKVRIIE